MDSRKQERAKRLDLMWKIDSITQSKCKPCPAKHKGVAGDCNSCEWFKQLREHGESLNALSRERRMRAQNKIEQGVEDMELTVDTYKDLKAQGKTDKEIKEILEIDHNRLYKFNQDNGLINSYGKNPLKKPIDYSGEIEVAKLKEKITNLVTAKEELTNENEKLKQENEQSQKELTEMRDAMDELIDEKNKLIRENEELLQSPTEHDPTDDLLKEAEINLYKNAWKQEVLKSAEV